jgi:hypothetical protein
MAVNLERKKIINLIEAQQRIYLNNMKGLKDKRESDWLRGCYSACTEIVRQLKELDG